VRTTSAVLAAALATGAVALLAGCSGSGSSNAPGALPGSSVAPQSHARNPNSLVRTGVAPKFFSLMRFGKTAPTPDKGAKPPKLLAVSDFGTGAIEVLNKSYQLTETITSGADGPDGDWYDKKANLYVANYAGINVEEYAKNSTSPSFTYSSGLTDPIGVTSDSSGNVYVADFGDGSASVVNEYPQGSNTASVSCSTGLANENVAFDSKGDVFVDGNNPNTGEATVLEYTGGLSGCHSTTLTVPIEFAGGMQIDKNNNLVIEDQIAGAVYIVPPPYSSASSSITGFEDPFHLCLNKKQNLLFVADNAAEDVVVVNYPAGGVVTTLGAANGLSDPAGVACDPPSKA
jgi:hypothetical protein